MNLDTTKQTEFLLPRFRRSSYPRTFGITLMVIFGFLTVINVMAILRDDSIWLILATVLLIIVCVGLFGIGVLAFLASFHKIRMTPEYFRLELFGFPVYTLPQERVRSVVATSREYRRRMTDLNINLLQLYWEGKHPQNMPINFQWSTDMEEALRAVFPNSKLLL